MKLKQKRGRQHDSLELEGDRISHSWSLRKENVTILHLKDGTVFAVIRHHWVAKEDRETFLSSLESKMEEIQSR